MFEWDDAHTEHIGWHTVMPAEAEEAFTDPERVPATAYRGRTGERRRAWIGATLEGRVLVVVYTVRDSRNRILMARDATEREYQRYVKGTR
jgi:uncharacterized protein